MKPKMKTEMKPKMKTEKKSETKSEKKPLKKPTQKRNKRTYAAIIFPACIIAAALAIFLYCLFNGVTHESMQWAKNLSAEDVESIEMVSNPFYYENPYKLLTQEEIGEAVALINQSRGRYLKNPEELTGGGITLYLHMKDGSEHEVVNVGNTYLQIDGDHYAAGYKWLSGWPWKEGDSPLPYGFYGTPVPEDGVHFQAKVLEVNENSLLVEPLPGMPERDSADQIAFSTKDLPVQFDLRPGYIIEVMYNGEIMETYPAQLGEVYGISVTDDTVTDDMVIDDEKPE